MFTHFGIHVAARLLARIGSLLILGLGSALAAPQLQLNMTTPQFLDTDGIGSNGEDSLGFGFYLLNGETANPPFTLRVPLPAHVTFRGFLGSNWACSSAASVVTCTYSQALTFANWQSSSLGVYIDVDGDLPVPGSSPIRATLESAQVPLPNPVVCEDVPSFNVATSDTGCVERIVQHRQSRLEFVPTTWQHNLPVFEAGTLNTIQVGWNSIGFGTNNGTVTARFLLPPGITYSHHGGITQWTCIAATPDAQGQLLTCTTPSWFDGMNPSQANIVLHVNVGLGVAVPGPVPIYGTISNAAQPPPDFALCDDPSPPVGCGYYTIPTRAPRISRMDIIDMQASQPEYDEGEEALVLVTYSNIGEGNATAATLTFAVPAGFAYDRNTASPALSCNVTSGSAATGQTLACRYAATYPAGVNGFVNLIFDVVSGAATQSTMIGSASDDGRPGPTLEQCIADPANPDPMVGCGRVRLNVSPWIFCDGFESPTLGCRYR
jgi:hypothetical protein